MAHSTGFAAAAATPYTKLQEAVLNGDGAGRASVAPRTPPPLPPTPHTGAGPHTCSARSSCGICSRASKLTVHGLCGGAGRMSMSTSSCTMSHACRSPARQSRVLARSSGASMSSSGLLLARDRSCVSGAGRTGGRCRQCSGGRFQGGAFNAPRWENADMVGPRACNSPQHQLVLHCNPRLSRCARCLFCLTIFIQAALTQTYGQLYLAYAPIRNTVTSGLLTSCSCVAGLAGGRCWPCWPATLQWRRRRQDDSTSAHLA